MVKSNAVNKLTLVLLLFFSLLWTTCDNDNLVGNNDFFAEASFSYQVEVVNHTGFHLNGVAGTISINGEPGSNSILITGKKRVESNSTADAREHLQELEVRVQDLTSAFEVKTIQPENTHGRNYIVDYTVTVPNHLQLVVNNVAGNVTINTMQNEVKLNNVSGNVILDEIAGNTFTETISGNIEGRITLPLDGTINMSTVSGNITLHVPENTSANLSASVVSGNINVSGLVLQNLVSTPRSLSGRCGEGRGTISLSTVSGNISLQGF